jgi:hypothetical protein
VCVTLGCCVSCLDVGKDCVCHIVLLRELLNVGKDCVCHIVLLHELFRCWEGLCVSHLSYKSSQCRRGCRDWFTVKMEVLCSFEILGTNFPVTRCHVPEDLTHPKPSLLRIRCQMLVQLM